MENSGGSIFQRLSVEINAFLKSVAPEMRDSAIAIVIIDIIIFLILYIVLFIIIMWIKSKIIARFKDKKGNSLTIQFLEKIITIALIVYFVVLPLGGDQIAKSILGSTAVVAAIVGFAAQDAIKDMFAGLQISIYKPFDVGSRIAFEDGTTGVVESMTLRHVVLVMLDTTRLIIPNSKANSMKIINYSYGDTPKSVEFRFPISYDSDLQKAKDVIRKTICENPLSLNKDSYDENEPNSRSVYFLSLDNSALIMGATVQFPMNIKTEVLKDEINSAVFTALNENGIKIPYNQIDVTVKTEDSGS